MRIRGYFAETIAPWDVPHPSNTILPLLSVLRVTSRTTAVSFAHTMAGVGCRHSILFARDL